MPHTRSRRLVQHRGEGAEVVVRVPVAGGVVVGLSPGVVAVDRVGVTQLARMRVDNVSGGRLVVRSQHHGQDEREANDDGESAPRARGATELLQTCCNYHAPIFGTQPQVESSGRWGAGARHHALALKHLQLMCV